MLIHFDYTRIHISQKTSIWNCISMSPIRWWVTMDSTKYVFHTFDTDLGQWRGALCVCFYGVVYFFGEYTLLKITTIIRSQVDTTVSVFVFDSTSSFVLDSCLWYGYLFSVSFMSDWFGVGHCVSSRRGVTFGHQYFDLTFCWQETGLICWLLPVTQQLLYQVSGKTRRMMSPTIGISRMLNVVAL